MIWESWPFRVDLFRIAIRMRIRAKKRRLIRRSDLSNIDKDIFYAAVIIRKLIEAKKVDDGIRNHKIPAYRYPLIDDYIDLMNNYRLERLYDFEKRTPAEISVWELCNQLIHSFVFFHGFGEKEELYEIFVSSDHKRNEYLQAVEIEELIEVLELVAGSRVDRCEITRIGDGNVKGTWKCLEPLCPPKNEMTYWWIAERIRLFFIG